MAGGIWEQPFTKRMKPLPRTHPVSKPQGQDLQGPHPHLPQEPLESSLSQGEAGRGGGVREAREAARQGSTAGAALLICQRTHSPVLSLEGPRGEIQALAHRCPPVGAVDEQHDKCGTLNGGPQKMYLHPRSYLESLCRCNQIKILRQGYPGLPKGA